MTDERGLKIAARGVKMIVPSENQFNAERLMKSQGRTQTADNDINALVSKGMVPGGYSVYLGIIHFSKILPLYTLISQFVNY